MAMSFDQLLDDVAMIYALLELDEAGDAQEIAGANTRPESREKAYQDLAVGWEKPIDQGPLGYDRSIGDE